MAFHYIRFPIDIALGARGGPRRQTDIVSLVSGAEERNSLWANSRRYFDAGYGVKSLADMRDVLEFFEERRGRFHSLIFQQPLSARRSPPVTSPLAQEMGRQQIFNSSKDMAAVSILMIDP